MQFKSFVKFIQTGIKEVGKHPLLIFFNVIIVIVFLLLTIYVKSGDQKWQRAQFVIQLFEDPFTPRRPLQSYLTNLSEILWCFSFAICSFSTALIQNIRPRRPINRFIFCSALILGTLLIDDIFRITLIAHDFFGIPKLVTPLIYGIFIIVYGFFFWRKITSTPYFLLLASFGLFIISGLASGLHLPGNATPAMLEDGTKLLALINLAYYFWYVCRNEVLSAKTRTW